MLFSDTYKTPASPAQAYLRERGSKFLAYVFPVTNEREIKQYLIDLRREFPDATHHCYAYKLGIDDNQTRINDDGEPANSAGRPILRAIQSAGITNVLVVVVRYFGGKLLGVSGLIQAYSDVAVSALKSTRFIEKEVCSYYHLIYPFDSEGEAFRFLKQQQATILQQTLSETGEVQVLFNIRLSKINQLMSVVKDHHKLKIHYLYTI
jgi:uncharacterized YigZ family protein